MYITVGGTATAIVFIVATFLLPKYATMLLSVEVVLLPSIYIIGSVVTERLIRDDYERKIKKINSKSKEVEEKYYKVVTQYKKIEGKQRK